MIRKFTQVTHKLKLGGRGGHYRSKINLFNMTGLIGRGNFRAFHYG